MMRRMRSKWLDYRNPVSAVNEGRRKRFRQLLKVFPQWKEKDVFRVVDLGGTFFFWRQVENEVPDNFRITLLNLEPPPKPLRHPKFEFRQADLRDPDFSFECYDLIFSNSLIEHLGSREAMAVFAEKVKGSGKPYAIQTPSFWFPLEPHSRVVGFQFLPRTIRAWMIWKLRIKYFPRAETFEGCKNVSDSTIMLTRRDLKDLFPEATVTVERLIGLPKSYTALSGAEIEP